MPNPSEVSPAMTAEEAVKAVYADARAVHFTPGIWVIAHGDDPNNPGYANLGPEFDSEEAAWIDAASRITASPVADPDTTCSHCGRDMNKRPWETCSHGGSCFSITEINERRQALKLDVEKVMDGLKQAHNGFMSPEEANQPVASPVAEGESQIINEDALLRALFDSLSTDQYQALTRTKWKDGIDVTEPTYGAYKLAKAILAWHK